jgi:Flp pilus assembly protein TadG
MDASADAQRRRRDLRAPTRVMPRGDDSGAVAVIVALWIVMLLGIGALAVDVGFYLVQRGKAQTAADAAALAAASYLPEDEPRARSAATDFATRNLPNGTATFTGGGATDPGRADVTVSVEVPTFFARVFGIGSVTAVAHAGAQAEVTSNRMPLQVVVVQDASGSFIEEWAQATSADLALMSLINQVSTQGDKVGFVAFSQGLKSTTYVGANRALGAPRKVNAVGDTDASHGQVMQLSLGLTALNYADPSTLPAAVDTSYQIARKDFPGGNTYPESGIDWAINQFTGSGSTGAEKVIVFVSDGMPNPMSHRGLTNAAAQRAGSAGIRIDTVTLTNESVGGSYGTSGADYQFNKDLVEQYNVGADGKNLGGVALQTSDPAGLRDLLLKIARIELRRTLLVD